MINILSFLISPSTRIFLIIISMVLFPILPLNIPFFVVFLMGIFIVTGIALELIREFGLIEQSKKFTVFRIVVLVFSSIFLFQAFTLFLKINLSPLEPQLFQSAIRTYLTYFYLLITFISLTQSSQLIKIFNVIKSSPALATVVSFSTVIIIGAMLLTLPISIVAIEKMSFIDSLFISASATCVTGLSTVDIGSYYTRFGQLIILLLIQIGGIGIITLALSLPIIIGSQTTFTQTMTIRDLTGVRTIREVLGVAKAVVVSTFIIEAIGALILFFADDSIESLSLRIFSAVFHSISAFCNAGFSIFPNNLEGYAENYVYITTVMFLVVLGGLGFPVTNNLFHFLRERLILRRKYNFSFHTKIVLTTSAMLIIGGSVLFSLLEWNNSLASYDFGTKLINSVFMSITPRTAGFNTVQLTGINYSTTLIIMVLMFIGASPSSTGGGIKTTTFATMLYSLRALIRNKEYVEAFRRTIPINSIYKALNVAFISFIIVFVSTFFLSLTERDKDFIEIIFEVFSAFGTVGLSLGITPQLSFTGKIIIIFTMLVGRIGPLTVAIVFSKKKYSGSYKYPEDHIIIG
ncbi:MAG: TrkH family potassium uptake protein [Deltaproteobacteria bacterium]|nr:TrkH family potassium uptake protein [Deltaproteobacteria bacterium]